MVSSVILKIRRSQLWLHQGHKIEVLTFFFNLTLNSTLSFPPASLFVFCDLRCRRLEGVAGTGNPSTALVEGEGDARRDGEGLTAFLRGGIANPSWGILERSPVFELTVIKQKFWVVVGLPRHKAGARVYNNDAGGGYKHRSRDLATGDIEKICDTEAPRSTTTHQTPFGQ